MTGMPGNVPKGYQVRHRLGAGQTSVVWLAYDSAWQREVALKLPKPAVHTDNMLRRMFENEVQITLKLDHPHTVRGFAGHPTGQGAFLALEYCSGGTLDQLLLERGKLPPEQAIMLVHHVAMGLEHTHQRKVLHRDVKPANVFLATDGSAKLGDFGTGTFQHEDVSERVGTAFYMAPEVFEGKPTSVFSDVYSLGVLAYEVLTGERPFVGDSYEALMVAHLHSLPRDLRSARPDLPSALARVVAQAMSRDPSRRFPNVTAFLTTYRQAAGLAPATTSTKPSSATPTPGGPGQGGRAGRGTPAAQDDTRPPKRSWWPFGRRRS